MGRIARRKPGTWCRAPTAALSAALSSKDRPIMNKTLVRRFLSDDQGLETVEYAIIAGLVVAGLVAIVAAIGVWVNTRFQNLQTSLGNP
jgi:pilus assembly protein Flp/PilA